MDKVQEIAREIEIKAHIINQGVRVEENAMEGVGTRYKEDIAWLFDFNVRPETVPLLPMELKLPMGSIAEANCNITSPYLIRKEDGTLFLEKDGEFITTLEWTYRPKFYNKFTSDGVEMKKVAQIRGECSLCLCFSNACANWAGGDQCRYCNINSARRMERNIGTVLPLKKVNQFGEVAAAALEEGISFHVIVVSGHLPGKRASDTAAQILETIKEYTGLEGKLPGSCNIAAPLDTSEIDRVYQAGVAGIGFNLECWDPNMFKIICPGKHKNIGREVFLRALEYAVSLWGRGYVYSALVCGLEEKEKYFEAAEYLAEKGVFPIVVPWFPVQGSNLEGHRAPTPEWILEVNEKVIDIIARHIPGILKEEYLRGGAFGCYRCQPQILCWDEIRRRLGGPDIVMPRDQITNDELVAQAVE